MKQKGGTWIGWKKKGSRYLADQKKQHCGMLKEEGSLEKRLQAPSISAKERRVIRPTERDPSDAVPGDEKATV